MKLQTRLLARFDDGYETAWAVSDVSSGTWSAPPTTSSCVHVDSTQPDVGVDRLLQRLLDSSHADTTRYHVTVTSSDDDEGHGYDDVTPAVAESAAWWSDDGWSPAWTLFVALDLLLVVARATVTYVNAAEICAGGRRAPAVSAAANHHVANGQLHGAPTACTSRLKADDADRSTWSLMVDAVSSRSLLVVFHVGSLIALLYVAARLATSSDVIADVVRR